jgi:hypothetical protein
MNFFAGWSQEQVAAHNARVAAGRARQPELGLPPADGTELLEVRFRDFIGTVDRLKAEGRPVYWWEMDVKRGLYRMSVGRARQDNTPQRIDG